MIPALVIMLPLLGAGGAVLADRYRPALRNYVVIAAVAIPLLLVAIMYPAIKTGASYYLLLNILPPAGLEFRVDLLSFYMAQSIRLGITGTKMSEENSFIFCF